MNTAELITQLVCGQPDQRRQALAGLIRLGPAAGPALRPLLADPDGTLRALAMQALAEIGDRSDADRFAHALDDPEPAVRARAAQGLAQIGDARAVAALIRTLDDLPDVLHHPATLATQWLAAIGPTALPALAPLLALPPSERRQRAWFTLHLILTTRIGQTARDHLVTELGRPADDDTPARRHDLAQRWTAWTARNGV